MGVKGFWKLVESTGTPVPLETLEHKILGVDVSIWLHQAVKGFRGPGGGAVANAHLLTLFHRICKLMYYRIRPVFVFDGGVPHLKKQTAASRRIKREAAASEAMKVRKRLLGNLLKSQAVRNALGKKGPGPSSFHIEQPKKREKDMFELPPLPTKAEVTDEGTTLVKTEEDSDDEEAQILRNMKLPNLHNFDFESDDFKNLPMETQHEILSELQDTRKENSWGTMNRMPQVSTDFSDFQMKRLLKRRNFQSYLDELREKIQKQNTAEIEAQLYLDLEKHVSLTETHRIVSEDSTHSILIKTGNDKEKQEAGILKDIEKCKGKSLMKNENKVDFLTHFSSQGLVSNRIVGQFSEDSDEDMDEDLNYEDKFSPGEMKEINETAFAQVCNFLVDNSELTQDEIMALIEQQNESKTSGDSFVTFDDQPTSSSKAQGIIFNPDADSSDEDSNFIEVQEQDLPKISDHSKPQQGKSSVRTEPLENQNNNKWLNSSNEHSIENEKDSTSNVDAILSTKTNSMYLKIVQSRLDDMIHSSENSSSKKAVVDSRKFNSPQKDVPVPQKSPKRETVAISLDFDLNPLKKEDDIFADIFESESSPISNPSFEPKKRRAPLQRVDVDRVTMPSAKPSDKSEICVRDMSELMKKETPDSATKNKNTFEVIHDSRNQSLSKSGQYKSPLIEKKTVMAKDESQSSAVNFSGMQPLQLDTTVKIDPELRAKVDSLVRQEIGKLIDTLKTEQENLKENGQEQKETKRNTKGKEDTRVMNPSESDSEEDAWTFKSKVVNGIRCNIMSSESRKVNNEYEIDQAQGQVSPVSDTEFMSSSESEDENIVGKENEKAASLEEEKEKSAYVEKIKEKSDTLKEERNSVVSLKELRPACNKEENVFVKKLGVSEVAHTLENSTEKLGSIEGKMNIKEDADSDDDDFIEVEEAGSSLGKELNENNGKMEVHTKPSGERGTNEKNEEVDQSCNQNTTSTGNAPVDEADVNAESNVERPMNYTNEELKRLETELASEQETLVAQAKKVDRVASNLTDQMYGEAQELLQLFGIPYLVAPMEAEAQCAFLDRSNLTHGTITDDSDIFLFGGTRVYKNFFNHNKHVEFFTANNIQFNIGLDRNKMIALAMLTGSDYTDGIESVGAVSAMEILSEFPGEGVECLKSLKKWWSVASNNVLPTYESKIKQKLAQLSLKESFPSEAVFKAYLEAEVDESKERFSWAVPNADALHTFTSEKFGWSNAKTNEILVPIMKRLGINETQMRIDSYYTKIKLVKENQFQSKRMQEAISKVKGETSPVKAIVNPKEKKSAQTRNKSQKRKQDDLSNDGEMSSTSEGNSRPTSSRTLLVDPGEVAAIKRGRKRKNSNVSSTVKENPDQNKVVVEGHKRTIIPLGEENADENDDAIEEPPKVLTKAEAKEKMYKALLEKEKIEQREKGKLEMIDKKRKAAELLQNIKLDSKKKKKR